MAGRKIRTWFLSGMAILMAFSSCQDENRTFLQIRGSVVSMKEHEQLSAFMILGEELKAETGADGSYEIDSLEPGRYELLVSSLNYKDTLVGIELKEGYSEEILVLLEEDESGGRVYGELHDRALYDAELIRNPEMADWTGKNLFDGVSGATIQTITFGNDLPAAEIFIGDSLIAFTDGFGQYWSDIQSGTYPLRVSLPGYEESIQLVRVLPDSFIYANFILSQKK